jgi:leucyl aminopeptidase
VRTGEAAARAVNFARDLINEPPSRKTPEVLGRAAQALSGKGVRVKVYRKADLVRMKADALLGVNRGSAHPPVMVHLHYKPAGKPRRRIALVGKGITFDSGGLSLKTAEGMMTMKYDMAGAAGVLGIFSVLGDLKPSVEVHGIAPITENLPGPDAYKPGDVVRAMNGKTIEVLNTDAEGRIVLSDALSYTAKLPVDEIVDVATLTGAAAIALGKSIAAVMSNDDALFERLRKAAAAAGEKVWRLPLEKEYKEHIRSKVADLKNIGNPGEAGTIIGGLFLEEFVAGKKWAHVDMASVGWNPSGTLLSPPGATGVPVRTLLNLVLG